MGIHLNTWVLFYTNETLLANSANPSNLVKVKFHIYQKLPLEGTVVGCTELSEGVLDQVSSSQG